MSLRTHNIEDLHVIGRTWDDNDQPSEPGQLVCCVFDSSAYGTIIAIDDKEASVLWSRESKAGDFPYMTGSSGFVFAPYVPMQRTPSIFSSGSYMPATSVTGSISYSKSMVNPSFYGSVSVGSMISSGSI